MDIVSLCNVIGKFCGRIHWFYGHIKAYTIAISSMAYIDLYVLNYMLTFSTTMYLRCLVGEYTEGRLWLILFYFILWGDFLKPHHLITLLAL